MTATQPTITLNNGVDSPPPSGSVSSRPHRISCSQPSRRHFAPGTVWSTPRPRTSTSARLVPRSPRAGRAVGVVSSDEGLGQRLRLRRSTTCVRRQHPQAWRGLHRPLPASPAAAAGLRRQRSTPTGPSKLTARGCTCAVRIGPLQLQPGSPRRLAPARLSRPCSVRQPDRGPPLLRPARAARRSRAARHRDPGLVCHSVVCTSTGSKATSRRTRSPIRSSPRSPSGTARRRPRSCCGGTSIRLLGDPEVRDAGPHRPEPGRLQLRPYGGRHRRHRGPRHRGPVVDRTRTRSPRLSDLRSHDPGQRPTHVTPRRTRSSDDRQEGLADYRRRTWSGRGYREGRARRPATPSWRRDATPRPSLRPSAPTD